MSKELDEFERLQAEKMKRQVKAQIVWAIVTSVDWAKKTMDTKSVVDGLELYDVLLGLGSFYRKPKIGTKCVLGILENKQGLILLDAEEFEEAVYSSGESEFTIKEDGFIIKQGDDSLKQVLGDFMTEVNKITVINGTSINVPAVAAIKNRLNNILIA